MRVVKTMLWTVMVSLALVAACASEKAPAEQALKTAEAAIGEIRGEAAKWVPDQARALEASLASAEGQVRQGRVQGRPRRGAGARGPGQGSRAPPRPPRRRSSTKTWEELSVGLPKMMDAVKSRVDILSKSKKLPANVSKEKFEAAKAGLAEATKGWEDATAAYKGGNVADAVAKADPVKRKTVEALEALGMPVPTAAKS